MNVEQKQQLEPKKKIDQSELGGLLVAITGYELCSERPGSRGWKLVIRHGATS